MPISVETLQKSTQYEFHNAVGKIREYPSRPDIILRINEYHGKSREPRNVPQAIESQRKLLKTLQSYGIAIPPFFSVEGPYVNEQKNMNDIRELHTFVRRVYGHQFNTMPTDIVHASHFQSAVQKTVAGLYAYIQNTENDAQFPFDIFYLNQWRFGRTNNDTQDKLYLVDIEPFYVRYTKKQQYESFFDFADTIQAKYDINLSAYLH